MSKLEMVALNRKRARQCEEPESWHSNAKGTSLKRLCIRKLESPHACDSAPASLDSLATDVFGNVLDFLGPTSQSLISLAQVNKKFHLTMKSIGDAMLPRALRYFRKPLRPKSLCESSTSLFIRHARICSQVLTDLENLRKILDREPDTVLEEEVYNALFVARNLLDVVSGFSLSLEKLILTTCGKCGGRVFKHFKNVIQSELVKGLSHGRKCEEFVEMSRFIMKAVICRELQHSHQPPTSLYKFVQRQIVSKQIQEAGCL
jgi:hypothetical protein